MRPRLVALCVVGALSAGVHCTMLMDPGEFVSAAGSSADSPESGASVTPPPSTTSAPSVQGDDAGDGGVTGPVDSSVRDDSGGTVPVRDSAPPSLCQGSGLIFCDDFEGRSAPKGPWDSTNSGGGTTLSIGAGNSSSGLIATTSSGSQLAGVQKTIAYGAVVANKVTLEFDMKFVANRSAFGSSQASDHANPFFFEMSNDEYEGYIEVGRNACDLIIDDQHYTATTLCSGSFVHVSYEVTFHATNGRVRVSLDGTSVAEKTGLSIPPPATFTFGLGSETRGTCPSITATFDNVTLR